MEQNSFYYEIENALSKRILSKPFITILRNPAIFDQNKINEIDKSLVYNLEQRKNDLNQAYTRLILPKLNQILNTISGKDYNEVNSWKK